MNRTILGLVLLGIVAAIAVGLTQFDLAGMLQRVSPRAPVNVSIFVGGEKTALLANPKVASIIKDRYKISLDATRAGSVEMVTTLDTTAKDCLWPSNAVSVEMARAAGKSVLTDETIFNSPIVMYAWADVATALTKAGLIHAGPDGTLLADVSAMGRLITSGKRWKEDLGLNIYGPFKITSTDPIKSNSGLIWSALLATAFDNGTTPTETDLPALLPQLKAYFASMGFMEASSGDLFENFLKQGMGARPIIIGYENQLVEFVTENQRYADLIKSKIKVIYPEPTIFASHPLISLTPACKRLAEALIDPDLQQIAWSEHGFRTGLIGVNNDPKLITVAKLPETVDLVVPMPSARVMTDIVSALQN
ncbi:MAG: hypothetical protein WCS20_09180 [Alphaproteobacteria bacterium]|jgi:hypothetical protein